VSGIYIYELFLTHFDTEKGESNRFSNTHLLSHTLKKNHIFAYTKILCPLKQKDRKKAGELWLIKEVEVRNSMGLITKTAYYILTLKKTNTIHSQSQAKWKLSRMKNMVCWNIFFSIQNWPISSPFVNHHSKGDGYEEKLRIKSIEWNRKKIALTFYLAATKKSWEKLSERICLLLLRYISRNWKPFHGLLFDIALQALNGGLHWLVWTKINSFTELFFFFCVCVCVWM